MSGKTSYVLPGIALVFIGFATGWFLQGARQGLPPRQLLSAIPTKTSRVNERLRIAINELSALTDPDVRRQAVERIPPEEMRAHLQALRDRAGLRGLNERDRDLLITMLAVWHAHNAHDTLTWILAHEDESNRINLLYRLLEAAELADPVGAMALGVENLISGDGRFQLPAAVLQAALADGPDTLLDCLRLAVDPEATGHLVHLDFPEQFDFAGFAVGLADHLESLPEGMHQLVLPQNLVEDWAKQDPTAAFLWASHHPEAATQPGVLASINAIAASPPKQAGAIFSQAIQAEGADPALVIAGLAKALHAEPNPQILTHFLTNLESEDAQEAQLAALFHTSFGPDQSLRSTRVRHLVLSGMTAEQRLGFLDGILHKHGSSPNQFQFDAQFDPSMRDELESLQHSNDEIATIMANFAPLPAPSSP